GGGSGDPGGERDPGDGGMSLLILSNGRGEDLVAGEVIIRLLDRLPAEEILVAPLIGKGEVYRNLGVRVLPIAVHLPSGGFSFTQISSLIRDLAAGLLWLPLRQMFVLRRWRGQVRMVACFGDVYLVILSVLALGRRPVFMATAKSVYTGGHLWIEKRFLRRYTKITLVRDRATLRELETAGVVAAYQGNPMVDNVAGTRGGEVVGDGDRRRVTLLPGSRDEAYRNLIKLFRVVERLNGKHECWAAISPNLDYHRIATEAERNGITFIADGGSGSDPELRSDRGRVMLAQGRFAELLHTSALILGLAGTAVEQAVGVGVPAVTFVGDGPQTTFRRMETQKRLLGDAVLFLGDAATDEIATQVESLLSDQKRLETMGEAGRARMGEPGAAEKIAALLYRIYQEQA
ncbi:MAG: lipid-A-disaccharide synthase-related protein, partial [Candidatus Bipolaricaulia bacterium]